MDFSLPKAAFISYFTTEDKTLIFLVKNDNKQQTYVFEAKLSDNRALTKSQIAVYYLRFLADFNGLTPNWESSKNALLIGECLELKPKIAPYRRFYDPNYDPAPLLLKEKYKLKKLTYMEEISKALLPKELKNEIRNCELLCFSPHGLLHALPFHALYWKTNEYLIERFGVCYTPSMSVLRHCMLKNPRRQKREYKSESCFVACVGTAENDPTDFENDINFLTDKFGQTTLVALRGSQASKNNVLKNMQNFDIIHFACHGLFGEEGGSNASESSLLLSDGGPLINWNTLREISDNDRKSYFLTAQEILNLRLKAELVTLRACSSGRAVIRSGDELMGLARSFLYAGTPSLIASLWNVNIKSSYKLLEKFYQLWLGKTDSVPKWKALQRAEISLLNDEREDYHHPYHWASLILIGDWL